MFSDEDVDVQGLYKKFDIAKDGTLSDYCCGFRNHRMTNNLLAIKERLFSATTGEGLIPIKREINELTRWISGVDSKRFQQIPSFDQKYFVSQIDLLLEKLETRKIELGKKRFVFSSKLRQKEKFDEPPHLGVEDEAIAIKPQFECVNGKYLELTSTSSGHLFVRDCQSSILKVPNTTSQEIVKSIHIENFTASILIFNCSGPLFITGAENCIIGGKCRQLRLKNVKNSKIYVDISNTQRRIVFEGGKNLEIGKVSNVDFGENFDLKSEFASDNTDFVEVDDFDFPSKATLNPHFRYVNTVLSLSWITNLHAGGLDQTLLEKLKLAVSIP
ncbi:unnamed protein product [Kuraishia capsulata CBS 1993]|uniref:C-CAP/cofactor C-like domain-containing protein n=1 Tax=Kuraishia capsulata CBS 1993 TaxID=1382522 RepID=W6MF68_9ASCO|nr:uncharacterized protein KUCA_T00000026001 [Kuraishia capsulata CBS 1993]CDK24066.1 unnamed protein product [Kuraishia capsulata CBS 1993]